jgi:hypothetical protein
MNETREAELRALERELSASTLDTFRSVGLRLRAILSAVEPRMVTVYESGSHHAIATVPWDPSMDRETVSGDPLLSDSPALRPFAGGEPGAPSQALPSQPIEDRSGEIEFTDGEADVDEAKLNQWALEYCGNEAKAAMEEVTRLTARVKELEASQAASGEWRDKIIDIVLDVSTIVLDVSTEEEGQDDPSIVAGKIADRILALTAAKGESGPQAAERKQT